MPLTPEQQIKALQVQLREAQEKAALFEAVVNVLKNDYGVRSVNKPSGTRTHWLSGSMAFSMHEFLLQAHTSLKMKTPDEVHRASIVAINQRQNSRLMVSI